MDSIPARLERFRFARGHVRIIRSVRKFPVFETGDDPADRSALAGKAVSGFAKATLWD
jgi:hypothetical protein